MSRSFLLCVLLTAPLFSQATSPSIKVSNAASRYNSLAPGSFAAVDVGAIGNVTPDITVNLTTNDGVGVRLTPIAPPTAPGVVNTTEVWVVIPPNARLGSALITTTMGGVAYNSFINLRSTAPGIFTAAYNGIGPALALNYPSTPNALTSAAVPNGIVTLFATGLNGVTAADVIVNVANVANQGFNPLYAGPQGQPGLDQINFVLPPNTPIGCYIPVTILVRGGGTNTTTLSVNHDPYACAHPLGLSYSQLKTLDAGGTINLARLIIDAADNTAASQPSLESASLNFSAAFARDVAAVSGIQGVPLDRQAGGPNVCYLLPIPNGGVAGSGSRTDVFPAGTIALGQGGKQLQLNQNGSYGAQVPADQLPFFSGGNWSLSATGGTAIGAFTQNIQLPQRLKFTNVDQSTTLNSQGSTTVRWDPSAFGYGDVIEFSLALDGVKPILAGCTPAWMGQETFDGFFLTDYVGKTVALFSTVHTVPAARPVFAIPYNQGEPIRGFADYNFTQRIDLQVK